MQVARAICCSLSVETWKRIFAMPITFYYYYFFAGLVIFFFSFSSGVHRPTPSTRRLLTRASLIVPLT